MAAKRALTNYLQAMEDFDKIYISILADLEKKFPKIEIKSDWLGTELLKFDQDRSKSAFLIANFYGDEVYASLSLLLCLEVCHTFDYNILAVPVTSKVKRQKIDLSFCRDVINFLEKEGVDLLVVFSQKHPYLDGFYVDVPSVDMECDRSRQIIKKVVEHGHEVGAFCSKYDKPTYSIVKAGEDEMISLAARKGIEAYRFVVSQDIWAGYRALITLMKR
ncbi:MAG: hypothetical protein OEZ21_05900 [Candidatus Bathyarchaeota archaeon]|nr:hypothetical protein [Candidatus Bathyarchaeota archaeon]